MIGFQNNLDSYNGHCMDGSGGRISIEGSGYSCARSATLRQSQQVSYFLPYARSKKLYEKTPQLLEDLQGVVLTRASYNEATGRPCICPIIDGESSANNAFGIKIPSAPRKPRYLRPDLATFIAADYADVQPVTCNVNHHTLIVDPQLTQKAWVKFLEIIQPTGEKFRQRGQGFLSYGQIGWSDEFPHSHEDVSDSVAIMDLTPSLVYQQTGVAHVVRGYTRLQRFQPQHHIVIGANRWFATAFFSVSDVMLVPTQGLLTRRSGRDSINVGERPLKGFWQKEKGLFDLGAHRAITQRYATPIGRYESYLSPTGYKTPQAIIG